MTPFNYHQVSIDLTQPKNSHWENKIERYGQLDECSMALAQATAAINPQANFIILASNGGSQISDLSFIQGEYVAPFKFVHTLPNVRSVAISQLLAWQGPMICVSDDPISLIKGLKEAHYLYKDGISKIWVMNVSRQKEQNFNCHFFEFNTNGQFKLRLGDQLRHQSDALFLENFTRDEQVICL